MTTHKNLISIIFFFIIWALMLQLIAYVATNRIAFVPDRSYEGLTYDNTLLKEGAWPERWWQRFDGNWYLSIVKHGYVYKEGIQSNIVFFPLYPLLIHYFAPLIGNNLALAGVLISLLSAGISCVLLYTLAKLEWDEKTASRAAYLLLLFPVSFYLISIYTEALFLVLSLASFYCAHTKRWALATFFGMLLTATRITGLAILPARLLELLRQRKTMSKKLYSLRTLFIFLTPLGFAAFAWHIFQHFGDASLIFKVQSTWQRNVDLSYQSITTSIQQYLNEFTIVASQHNPEALFTRYIDVSFFVLYRRTPILA